MKSSSNKNLIITFVIIIALCAAGYMYITRDTAPSSDLLVDIPTDTATEGSFLSALNQLQVIRLDTTIFDNAVFESLTDISTRLSEQPSGRPNPFAPIDSSAITQTSVQTQTSTQTASTTANLQ